MRFDVFLYIPIIKSRINKQESDVYSYCSILRPRLEVANHAKCFVTLSDMMDSLSLRILAIWVLPHPKGSARDLPLFFPNIFIILLLQDKVLLFLGYTWWIRMDSLSLSYISGFFHIQKVQQ